MLSAVTVCNPGIYYGEKTKDTLFSKKIKIFLTTNKKKFVVVLDFSLPSQRGKEIVTAENKNLLRKVQRIYIVQIF